jgi:hypothetical protein
MKRNCRWQQRKPPHPEFARAARMSKDAPLSIQRCGGGTIRKRKAPP